MCLLEGIINFLIKTLVIIKKNNKFQKNKIKKTVF
jgi:hypothetical protein